MSISIHALLAESDLRETVPSGRHVIFLSTLSLRRATRASPRLKERIKDFYPRSPCGERHLIDDNSLASGIFLSTLSLRRATQGNKFRQSRNSHFYPRSPCGERRGIFTAFCVDCLFLSTLSLRRATGFFYAFDFELRNFYPRSPCGERQAGKRTQQPNNQISIHALLAESD